MWQQCTLREEVQCTGLGLHSGRGVTIALKPAPADSGIVFRRVDLPGRPEIPARLDKVVDSRLATTLGQGQVTVGTVEHLLAALAGCGIDNLVVELDGPEVPIMDGSAGPFMLLVKSAGVKRLGTARRVIRIRRPIGLTVNGRSLEIRPANATRISCGIKFDHPLLGEQNLTFSLDFAAFDRDISRARTFGFLEDVEKLKRAGLARGGSLDNAIVIDRFQILNPSGLRYPDEFVRHKILDLIGDLALLGRPLIGHVLAHKSGHAMNHALGRKILESPRSWELVTLSQEIAPLEEEANRPVVPSLVHAATA